MSGTVQSESALNPWDKSSVLIGGIWIVFLAFPVISAWSADAELWARVATVACLVAFAVVYLWGYAAGQWTHVAWRPVAHVVALIILAAAAYPVAGLNAPITCLIFIMAYCVWAFPFWVSMGSAVAAYIVMVAIVLLSGEFSEWWYLTALSFIIGVGLVISRVAAQSGERHQEVEKQLAMAQERERVARDVHDLLGHTLTAITVKAELAEKLIDVSPERARAEVAEIQELSREAITEVRHTVGSLRARRLDSEVDGAAAALRDAGITVEVPDDVTVVEPRLRMLFAWVVREATTNVLRHSDADRCWIELGPSRVAVIDDGRGAAASLEGNGLRGLRERVEEAGGSLTVASREHGWTTVEVTV